MAALFTQAHGEELMTGGSQLQSQSCAFLFMLDQSLISGLVEEAEELEEEQSHFRPTKRMDLKYGKLFGKSLKAIFGG